MTRARGDEEVVAKPLDAVELLRRIRETLSGSHQAQ
jgi:hypothetical protein